MIIVRCLFIFMLIYLLRMRFMSCVRFLFHVCKIFIVAELLLLVVVNVILSRQLWKHAINYCKNGRRDILGTVGLLREKYANHGIQSTSLLVARSL